MATKTIYFGVYTQDELDEMGISGFEFEGSTYEFKMEIHPLDGFMQIFDSCGRMIPLDMTHYGDLAKALELARALQKLENHRARLESVIYGGKSAVGLGSDSKVAGCEARH